MTTVEEIYKKLVLTPNSKKEEVLREWAESVIDECQRCAKTSEGPHYGGHGPEYYTGVDAISILSVKQQL